MLRSAFLAFAFCILSSPNALSRNATPRIVRSSGNSPFAPSTTDEALSESDQRNELLRTPEPSVPLNTLHQRQSSLPTLVFSFVVPSLDQTFAPLKDLFRVVVDDLQAQGVLSGANILVQPNTTGQSRTAVVGSIVNVATVDPSLGVIDLSPYPLDAASLASLFAFPLCEPRADFQELSDADTYTTLFRTTTDDSLRDAPVLDFVADQGWPQITNLYTSFVNRRMNVSESASSIPGSTVILKRTTNASAPPDYSDALKRIRNLNTGILDCDVDGSTLLAFLQQARSQKMLGPNFLYIIQRESYSFMRRQIAATDLDLIEGAIIVSEPVGKGPAYSSLMARWNTSIFRTKYPLLRNIATPSATYLYSASCLDLMLRGYDRVLRSNSSWSLSTLSAGARGLPSGSLTYPDSFSFPTVDTVTGKILFHGNSRIGFYVFSYVLAGNLVDFATLESGKSLNYTAPIMWRDGAAKPSGYITTFEATDSFWIKSILIPILVAICVFILLAGLWVVRHRHLKKKREAQPSKLGQNFQTVDIKSPAQKAIEILQEFQTDGRKRKLSGAEVDFIIEVLGSGAAFNPNIDQLEDVEGARVDHETRAWVLDLLAATPGQQPPQPTLAGGPGSNRGGSSTASDTHVAGVLDTRRNSQKNKKVSIAYTSRRSVNDPNKQPNSIVSTREDMQQGSGSLSIHSRHHRSGSPTAADGSRSFPRAGTPGAPEDEGFHTSSKTSHNGVIPMLPTISSMEVVKIEEYLNLWYRSWNFDMFNFAELTNGHPLLYSGVHLLENNEALQCLQLNPQTFRHWLLLMESQYHSHPYHNAAHAADVLHAINQLLLDDQLKTQYTPIEAFALMLGAIGHDIDHPGYNNAFLVKSRHPWAILYCDTSVLELHHCAHLFTMTLGSQCDIFAEFCAEEYDEIRKLVIKLILATDMGKHFEYINKFKSRISTGTLTFGMELNPDNKVAVAEIAMKCSDLCNPTKIFPLSKKWTDAVMEEFYLQGDRERELGLPVSQFMDRNNTNVPKCQIGFIDFLVAPLFDSWNTFRNHDDKTTRLIVELGKNRGSWAALAAHHTPQSSVFGQSQSRFTASRQQLPSTPSIPNPPSMQGSGSINQADLPPQRSNILGLGSKRNSVVVDIPTGIPSMSRAGSQFASLARRMSSFELLTSRSEGIKDNGPLLIEPTDVKVGGDAV